MGVTVQLIALHMNDNFRQLLISETMLKLIRQRLLLLLYVAAHPELLY